MTIDQLIKRLEDIRSVYGEEIHVCKGVPCDGKFLSVLEYIDGMDVCDAEPSFPKNPELVKITNRLKIKALADYKNGVPMSVPKGLIRVLFLN